MLLFFQAAASVPDLRLSDFAPQSGRGLFADPTVGMGGQGSLAPGAQLCRGTGEDALGRAQISSFQIFFFVIIILVVS